VDVIYVADDVSRFSIKYVAAQTLQKLHFLKATRHICHTGLNKMSELKLLTALGDFYGSNASSPVKNILE
jgi:hypothetical protein